MSALTTAFSAAFDSPNVTGLVTTTWTGAIDDHVRPRWPPWSPLWVHFHFPDTQAALALWRVGIVQELWSVNEKLAAEDDADAIILGGTAWVVPETDWTVSVMRNAGYPVVAYP